MSTSESRQEYLGYITGCIHRYVREGRPVRLRTWHGASEEANAIAFLIADWPAFVQIMEPGDGEHRRRRSGTEGARPPGEDARS